MQRPYPRLRSETSFASGSLIERNYACCTLPRVLSKASVPNEYQAWAELRYIVTADQRVELSIAKAIGISTLQARALLELRANSGELTNEDLGERLQIANRPLTRLVTRMCEKKLVDLRRGAVRPCTALTDNGWRVADKVADEWREWSKVVGAPLVRALRALESASGTDEAD